MCLVTWKRLRQFVLIVVDRVLYLWRAVRAKALLQVRPWVGDGTGGRVADACHRGGVRVGRLHYWTARRPPHSPIPEGRSGGRRKRGRRRRTVGGGGGGCYGRRAGRQVVSVALFFPLFFVRMEQVSPRPALTCARMGEEREGLNQLGC